MWACHRPLAPAIDFPPENMAPVARRFSNALQPRTIIIVILLMIAGGFAARFGPIIVSYLLIPPERGYYRYYREWSNNPLIDWNYYFVEKSYLASGSFRENRFDEDWEIFRGSSSERFLYDRRDEFDGEVRFSRTEMILRFASGAEEHYPRELDLWKIWVAKANAKTPEASWRRLVPAREAYLRMIAARMKEAGASQSPATDARRRPPIIKPAVTEPNPYGPALFAVTEFGTWNNTGTVLAVYADGTTIYRDMGKDETATYYSLKAESGAKELETLLGGDISDASQRYDISSATDQPITTLWLNDHRVSVYGRFPFRMSVPSAEDFDRPDYDDAKNRWDALPAAVRQTLENVEALRKTPNSPWLPRRVEITFSEFEHARGKVIAWPQKWPGLYDQTSRKRASGSYRVFISPSDLSELRAVLPGDSFTAIMIDYNKMAAGFRFPFPAEDAWMGPAKTP
jgi:hypothetical protein